MHASPLRRTCVLQIDEKNSTCSVDHEDPALETGIVPACSAMRFHASLLVHGAGVQVYIRERASSPGIADKCMAHALAVAATANVAHRGVTLPIPEYGCI